MTIVDPRPLHAHASVPEKELHCVQAGVEGKAVPVGYPDLKFAAKVEKVGLIAQSGGTFDARFTVAAPAGADSVMPGMTCKITLVTYQKKDALTIPPGSLFTDEADPDVQYVYLAGTNGKHEKRTIKVGRKTDKKVEIVEGLKAGDEILLEEPAKK
jgi:multidrug efflux pump subunit AcrA (membrane-fusion protein)